MTNSSMRWLQYGCQQLEYDRESCGSCLEAIRSKSDISWAIASSSGSCLRAERDNSPSHKEMRHPEISRCRWHEGCSVQIAMTLSSVGGHDSRKDSSA